MKYSVSHDLRDYLVGNTSPPDSIIDVPLTGNHIVVGAVQEFKDRHEGVQIVLKGVSGVANPRWVRDDWTLAIQAVGEDKGRYLECEQMIHETLHTFLGSDTLYIGDRAYLQFTSNQLPVFVGYLDNSKPVFSATIRFVVEGLKDEYNRKALC